MEIPLEVYERKQSWATEGTEVQRLVGEISKPKGVIQGSRGTHGEQMSVTRKLA